MKSICIRTLLALLNSRWLNNTSCRYEFCGNVDAFTRSDIEYSLRANPAMTLQEYINSANRFKACPINPDGLTVIDGDDVREANVWDLHDLRRSFDRKDDGGGT